MSTKVGSTTEEQRKAAPAQERATSTKIYRADSAELGRILFDESGFTLYRFFADEGSTPSCYGACAKQWPALLAEGELKARKLKVLHHLGTTKRKDGTLQITYFGHPLYTFVGDKETGDTNGNEVRAFGAQWYAMHPNGHKAQGGESQ